MLIDILSLFEEYFKGPFDVSILKRAIEKGLIEIRHTNIRDFSKDKHKRVDDRPFGGGPGMVLMPGPVVDAIRSKKTKDSHVIYLSPQGRKLNWELCKELAEKKHLVLLCGHYEGIDQRIIEKEVDEEISIGDYVLTNGCIAAVVLIDAVVRYIPNVLGNPTGAIEDSFDNIIFEGPSYTRPEEFEQSLVPKVLRQGNHAEIKKWKLKEALKKTRKNRQDLYMRYLLKSAMK